MTSLIGRFNRACTKRPWVPEHLQYEGAFEESLQKLWFDTHVHDPRVLKWVIDIMGTERLLLGTNFAGWGPTRHDTRCRPDTGRNDES